MSEQRKQIDQTLGNLLFDVRMNFSLTQVQMAQDLNLTQTVVGYYESGFRLPSIAVLEKYGELYGADMIDLYEARITTVKNTVSQLGDKAPPHILDEYKMILYLESKINN